MSELTEVIITVSLLVGGFLLIFSTYIFGVCKNKSHNNFIMFNTLLMIYDWIFYIILNIWIWIYFASNSYNDENTYFVYMILICPILTILCSMVFFNSVITSIILRREINNNEQFRAWFQEHKVFCMFIAFCSLGNLNILHVLNCKFNYMDIFDAKLSFTVEKKIIHAGVISLFADIARLISLLYVNSLLFYESMIRGYEKPTVQELIVNKKQFSEA
ncbi:hypothetical protein RhiirA4_472231 [Rhizophagus irregularis]|uniref:Uncharacterized protein n=1 Tax=Rhizophagus irregularis TaxID=588596 RepID=A0A2I1H4K3_9GLOM|nr:hypothetical protein RhiirA4_472231 [Rhizophagus irregularis]